MTHRKGTQLWPLAAALTFGALIALGLSAAYHVAAKTASERGVAPAPLAAAVATAAPPARPRGAMVFAVIGDYGAGDDHERAVAKLVTSWHPAFIVTTGDNYYTPAGGTGTGRYDLSSGKYYRAWIKNVSSTVSSGSVGKGSKNAFFPSLGNHDYSDAEPGPGSFLEYFDLPGAGFANSSGNERYYDFIEGDVHFFVLNSNEGEPDGTSSTSKQATWLRLQLSRSTSRWNIVYEHHPPYSSDDVHGSIRYMQWPFAAWGADAVLSGHGHVYERLTRDGVVYFVNGLGGGTRYTFGAPVQGSEVRYSAQWGAQKVSVTETSTTFEFYDVTGKRVDAYRLAAKG